MQVPRPRGRFAEPASLEPFPGAHTSTRSRWSCFSMCRLRPTALRVCPVRLRDVGDMSRVRWASKEEGQKPERERTGSSHPPRSAERRREESQHSGYAASPVPGSRPLDGGSFKATSLHRAPGRWTMGSQFNSRWTPCNSRPTKRTVPIQPKPSSSSDFP